jgi:hypothetical protein
VAYEFDKTFRKRLRKKPHTMQAAVLRTVKKLDEDPKRPGLRVHQIEGTEGVWEASIDDSNRVTFERHGDDLYFLNHCNHDILKRA